MRRGGKVGEENGVLVKMVTFLGDLGARPETPLNWRPTAAFVGVFAVCGASKRGENSATPRAPKRQQNLAMTGAAEYQSRSTG